MAQDVAADAPDKASVSFQQGGEGGFLATAREASEELCVGQLPAWNSTREVSEASQNGGKLRFSHQVHSRKTGYRYCSRNARSGYGNFPRLPSVDRTSPVMPPKRSGTCSDKPGVKALRSWGGDRQFLPHGPAHEDVLDLEFRSTGQARPTSVGDDRRGRRRGGAGAVCQVPAGRPA